MKLAIVTGGNKGIGYAICEELSKDDNIKVILTARDSSKGQEAASKLGVDFAQLDITDSQSVQDFTDSLGDQAVDYLFNNAGISGDKNQRFPNLDIESVEQVLKTNLVGHIDLTQKLWSNLQKSEDGRIINVSSGMGQFQDVGGGWTAYRISKSALNMFTATIAAEIAGENVKIVSVCPGWVRTDMGGNSANLDPNEAAQHILKLIYNDAESGKFYRYGEVISY